MRNYYLGQLEFAGYRKFSGESQILDAAVPDYETPGSGLNLIVGSIGSGKTSLLELIGLVNSQGMFDRDKLAVNDAMDGLLPTVSATFRSPSHGQQEESVYPFRVEFAWNGRRVQEAYAIDLAGLADEDRPNSGQQMKYIRANRTFKGSSQTNGPAIIEAIDSESRTETINLTGIANAISQVNVGGSTNIDAFRNKLQSFSHIGLEIEDIRMTEPSRGEQPIRNFEAKVVDGDWHNVQDLSDGTKELLCWIYELNFGDSSNHKIVCIDEIERSLHPQVQAALLEVVKDRAMHQQFFVTTHSLHIADPHAAAKVHRLSKNGVLCSVAKEQFPTISVFSIDHRRIFFSDQVLFVEGIDDRTFYTQKLVEYGYPELVSNLFMLGGKGNTEKFEVIVKALNINFHAIVDDDFSDRVNRLNSDKRRFLQKIVAKLTHDGVVTSGIDTEQLDTALSTPVTIPQTRSASNIPGKHYRKVRNKNVYPLKFGRLEEYAKGKDRLGQDVSSEQEAELRDIFATIKAS